MFEREYRELSFVPRWSVARTIKTQSVAEHCFYVALYAQQTAMLIDWTEEAPFHLMHHALTHDLMEVFSGDIPGPYKRHAVDKDKAANLQNEMLLSRFNSEGYIGIGFQGKGIREIVKFADVLDEVMFLCSELQLGNNSIGKLWDPNDESPLGMSYKNLKIAWADLRPYSRLNDAEFKFRWDKVFNSIHINACAKSHILDNP